MGNVITNEKVNSETLRLNNSATGVLASMLALSACDVVQSGWEKHFAQWVVSLDWKYRGLGIISFDISDIGWNPDGFETQKHHVLKIIDMAIKEHRWSDLGYTPHPGMKDVLKQFRRMVELFEHEHIDPANALSVNDDGVEIPLCPIHHVYLNVVGCVICNDQ